MKKKNKKNEDTVKLDIPTTEELAKKEEKKEKRKTTNYALKFFSLTLASVVLIVLAILIFCLPDLATKITVISIGLLVIGFGLIRLIPLMKSNTLKKQSKLVYGIEISLDTIIGLVLFILGLYLKDNVEDEFIVKYFRFFVGGVFYFKGVFYFITTSLLNDKTNNMEFWMHIVIMTLGTLLFAADFSASTLALILASLLLAVAVILALYAISAYKKYRGGIDKGGKAKKVESKEDVKKDEKKDVTILDENTNLIKEEL